jgi:flagellar basal-body rod modification protein FlgD
MTDIGSIGNIVQNRQRFAHLADDNRGEISIETFYQLLIAEMSNQDPLDPMSNTEFISQLASFTSLQVQQEALYFNNANYAQSMIGRMVVVASGYGERFEVDSGVVSSVDFTGGDFTLTVNGHKYPLDRVMQVVDPGYGMAGSNGAFATSLIGKYVTVGIIRDGGAISESGIVQRVEIRGGEINVIIDDLAYPLSTVSIVEPPEAAVKDDTAAQTPGGVLVDND